MKKLILLFSVFVLATACSKEDEAKTPSCNCEEKHNFYNFIDNQWVLTDTHIEPMTETDCNLNGITETVMHPVPDGTSIREDIIINCH